MLRIFTTPSIMQNYLADPITYRFLDKLDQVDNLIVKECNNEIYIRNDRRVPQILDSIIKRYHGFRVRSSEDFIRWIHPMKASRGYRSNRLVIELRVQGEYLVFTSGIQHGKKARRQSGVTIFAWLAFIAFFMLLGFVGSYELDRMTTVDFLKYASVSLASFGLFSWLEQKLNPILIYEE